MIKLFVSVILSLFLLASSAQCTDYEGMLSEARVLVKAGKLQQAIAVCDTITQASPGGSIEPRVRLFMGNLLTKAGRPSADAIVQFARIADGFPNSPEAPNALLRIGYLRDKTKQSPTEWQQLVDRYPQSQDAALALYRLGSTALKQGDPDLAVKRFLAVATIKRATPKCIEDSLVAAGYAHISRYWKTKDNSALSDAMTHLTSLKSRKLSNTAAVRVHLALGESCLILGYCREAAREYQEALDLHPQSAYLNGVAQFELASAFYGKGDWDAALKAYDEFLASQSGASLVDKDTQWRSIRPGYTRLKVQEPEKIKSLTGLELIPLAAYWKAETLRHLKRCSDAKAIADEVLAGFPQLTVRSRVEAIRDWCADVPKEAK